MKEIVADLKETVCASSLLPPLSHPSARRREPEPLRGALRLLDALRHAALTEVPLKNGRRADILSIGDGGEIWIVEVKSCLADFRADSKWPDYIDCCDKFFFAVGPAFPCAIIPQMAGLIVADNYDAVLVREPQTRRIAPRTRQALTLRFGRLAASRLRGLEDPLSGRYAAAGQ